MENGRCYKAASDNCELKFTRLEQIYDLFLLSRKFKFFAII